MSVVKKLMTAAVLLWPAWAHAQEVQYYHLDAIGNVRAVTDATGAVIERHDYLPFGEECTTGVNNACAGNPGLTGGQPKHFTGKERDTETGLDYFGARYYRGSLGRFTSVDPASARGALLNPQKWNRYVYVHNNPLAFVDPTGMYDLKNSCGQADAKCNQQFDASATHLRQGLSRVRGKLGDVKDPIERARLEAALAALGTENDGNGVAVRFGDLGDAAAATDPIYDQDADKYRVGVTFDPTHNSDDDDWGISAAHEGTHVADYQSGRMQTKDTLSSFAQEYRGYQTSAWAASALGKGSRSYRGEEIWNRKSGLDDDALTRMISGIPGHTETTPHNPWSN